MRETVRVAGKLRGPSQSNAATLDGSRSGHIFVTDRNSKIRFLVDTGADLCVFPRSCIRGHACKSDYELYAANGTRIATYGTTTLAPTFLIASATSSNTVKFCDYDCENFTRFIG